MEMIFGDGPAQPEDKSDHLYEGALVKSGLPEEEYLDKAKDMVAQSDAHLEALNNHIRSVRLGEGRKLAHWEVLYHTAMSEIYVDRGTHYLNIHTQLQTDRIEAVRGNIHLDFML